MSYMLSTERVVKLIELTRKNKIRWTKLDNNDSDLVACTSSYKKSLDRYFCRGLEMVGNKFFLCSDYVCDVDLELYNAIINNSNDGRIGKFESLVDRIIASNMDTVTDDELE